LSSGKESRKPEGLKNGGFVALSINTEYTPDKFRKQTPMLAIGVYECVDYTTLFNLVCIMNIGGWIFLILSWGFIIGLTIFCFCRVFSKKATG